MNTPRTPYEALLTSRGVDLAGLVVDARGTLAATPAPMGRELTLPVLRMESNADGLADVRMHEMLGEGGMGRVFAAEQVALGREVAVKMLREDDGDEALLREALIAGRLEHPNVVPVYLLGRAPGGETLFVMRRIEGVQWSAVLKNPDAAPGMFGGVGDPLELHLEVFLKVCDAMQFAHSRGIIHRDLKPDNVMLGAYREVYVVDWGIAVSLADDPTLPLASEARTIAGTPAYMAPEMAVPDGGELSVRTDIYLLGAVLHQVITGRAPHVAPSLLMQLAHAYESPVPTYGPEVPADVAEVCRRAMARSPDARFATVDELRRAVQECVRHRSSWALSEEADRRAQAMREEIAAVGDARDGGAAARVQGLFAECRFAYKQALAAWEENPAAATGLQRALEVMVGYELGRDNPRVAAELLAQMPERSEALSGKVAEALRDADERVSRIRDLERFRREADVNLGAPLRGRLGAMAGLAWSVICFVSGWLDRSGRWIYGYREALIASVTFAVMCSVLARYMARGTPTNDAQQRFLWLVEVFAWGFIAHWVICWALHIPMRSAMALFLLWVCGGWIATALLYDRRITAGALAFGVGSIGGVLWPSAMFEVFSVTTLVAYALVLFAWSRTPRATT